MRRQDLIPEVKDRSKQFVVVHDSLPDEPFAHRIELGAYTIGLFPGLPFHRVLEATGGCIGLFLGHVVDYRERRLHAGDLRIDSLDGLDREARIRRVEDFAYGFGGRWIFFHIDECAQRIYLDADGSQSLVYDPKSRRAASTAGLLLDDPEYTERFDGELYQSLGVSDAGWFPSGLTAHHGIRRLLCNHFLDLSSWTIARHWPVSDLQWTDDTRRHALRIAEIARQGTEAVLANRSVAFSLTAGNESRFLLAAYREFAHDLDFVTVENPGTEMDVHHAAKLAERFGLRHRRIASRTADASEIRAWQYAAGHCIGGSNMFYHPSIRSLGADYFLGGLGGEIGRAFFWRPGDDEDLKLDGGSIVPRFGMPIHERVVHATEEWFESVRHFNPLTQLDLAYLELRMSAWAFAQSYAQDAIVDHLHPMICREAYRLMLELPPDAKRENRFILTAIEELWPELLELPINRYGDARDMLIVLRKFASPTRVVRKIRKFFR